MNTVGHWGLIATPAVLVLNQIHSSKKQETASKRKATTYANIPAKTT